MKSKLLLLGILIIAISGIILISGCIKQPVYQVPEFQATQTEFSEQEILSAVHSSYQYPEDFYEEDFYDNSFPYYENSISVGNEGASTELIDRIELCTDNKEEAIGWVKFATAKLSDCKNADCNIGEDVETEKYFEFRIPSKVSIKTNTILRRVHKCSYLSNYLLGYRNLDESANKNTLSIFNKRPITTENTKELIEYLWFTHPRGKILSSFIEDMEIQ